ncbi:MAG: hypothetical protein OXC91_13230 [Rhodobacteraceae bacterium]|nr:hypothetical protein [Paracoccaceae bacterium]
MHLNSELQHRSLETPAILRRQLSILRNNCFQTINSTVNAVSIKKQRPRRAPEQKGRLISFFANPRRYPAAASVFSSTHPFILSTGVLDLAAAEICNPALFPSPPKVLLTAVGNAVEQIYPYFWVLSRESIPDDAESCLSGTH